MTSSTLLATSGLMAASLMFACGGGDVDQLQEGSTVGKNDQASAAACSSWDANKCREVSGFAGDTWDSNKCVEVTGFAADNWDSNKCREITGFAGGSWDFSKCRKITGFSIAAAEEGSTYYVDTSAGTYVVFEVPEGGGEWALFVDSETKLFSKDLSLATPRQPGACPDRQIQDFRAYIEEAGRYLLKLEGSAKIRVYVHRL